MKIEEYQKIIEQTAVFPTTVDNFGLAYCYLGLVGEFDEFIKALDDGNIDNIKKEIGDFCWYLSAFCKEADIDINSIWNFNLNGDEKFISLTSISENIKKYYRDNKPLNKKLLTKCLTHSLWYIHGSFIGFFPDKKLDFDEIRQINYTKLMKRRETNTLHGDGDNREVTE